MSEQSKMRSEGQMARMEKKITAYRVLVEVV
jgi:hypothetical protein